MIICHMGIQLWEVVVKKGLLAGLGVAAAVVYATVVCLPAKADAQMDAEIQKWHDTPAQELSAKTRAFVEKNLKEKGESTDLKATMEKIRPFPGGSMTVICGIAGDRVFSMLLTFHDGDASKNSGSLYLNGFDNRIAKVCAGYGF